MLRCFYILFYAYTSNAFSQNNSVHLEKSAYSITSTYQKLIAKYPEITLPILALPPGGTLKNNIPYKVLNNRSLTLDVYSLKSQIKKQPLIMLIHGGGWQSGQPSLMRPLAIGLAKHGYVVAVASYRLSGEAKYPAGVYDLIDALLWLKEHSANYNIDDNNIVLAGTSAGGQLAALLAYSGGQLTAQPKIGTPFTVQALLNIDGLSDFTSLEALPFENDPKKNPSAAGAWFGGRYEEVPDLWKQASPIYYINEKSPPTLFLNGEKTRFHAGRDAAIDQLNRLNIHSKVIKLDNAPHSFWLLNPWLEPTIAACADFLDHTLNITL
ncbi:alpha/beta hydrolase [Colwellia sp. MB02u-18]|uniref:alpha/beta hydrolase n=1 Tax=unclassified Colwellia TaxID=196834 RepID=UPI0015F51F79|nr:MULTISPECIES: alpha/beta hydrolase [unclassified Colwellia]MBA6222647.1 alpha/beta hydrolase [Colwellia sp. MB3u-45]MBA6269165.1 alpha/beta hydrolase [Colwellia sp. MB3u-43]MBA6322780.1 alpha/beta hydrolase [Colwellia sp. MB02u-19]MBA6323447.1 alpha/beta hydrolase [Colwellia sp. MB02u-18]MBA6332923.1 alpha/beta hydrolase [Colwellia sp. MB02u-12]